MCHSPLQPVLLSAALAISTVAPAQTRGTAPVPGRGTAPAPGQTEVLIPKTKGRKKPKKIPYQQRINLNAASREELMKVPTIDAATADRIIAGRPYKTTGDLLLRNIVPGAHFWTVKDKVTAGPASPKASTGKAPGGPAKK